MALANGPSIVRIADPPYSSLHYKTATVRVSHVLQSHKVSSERRITSLPNVGTTFPQYIAEEVFRLTRFYELRVPDDLQVRSSENCHGSTTTGPPGDAANCNEPAWSWDTWFQKAKGPEMRMHPQTLALVETLHHEDRLCPGARYVICDGSHHLYGEGLAKDE